MHFTATKVECSEAMDYEIVQVRFDTQEDDPEADSKERASPYLMLGANFEFDDEVQIDCYDGSDYGGGRVASIALWPARLHVIAGGGREFDIGFQLSKAAFTRLRRFLKILFGADCFQERATLPE